MVSGQYLLKLNPCWQLWDLTAQEWRRSISLALQDAQGKPLDSLSAMLQRSRIVTGDAFFREARLRWGQTWLTEAAIWHGNAAEPEMRNLFPDGTSVISLDSGHVFCLKLYRGNQRIRLSELIAAA